jgi:hypothetical protein
MGRQYEYMYEEHSDECMDDTINIHEQSECYMCKQYECNEYVRSALARSKINNTSACTRNIVTSAWTMQINNTRNVVTI